MLKKHKLFSNAIKMVKKMVFAFKFQEQTFPLEFLKSPLANQVCNERMKENTTSTINFSLELFSNFLSIRCQSSGRHWIKEYLVVCSKEQVINTLLLKASLNPLLILFPSQVSILVTHGAGQSTIPPIIVRGDTIFLQYNIPTPDGNIF